ncbi:MAG: hypothetical protein ACRENM_05595 [Candidatus Dormibacteraceae bacterium]
MALDKDWGVSLSAYGEIWCPPVGNSLSAYGEFLLSAVTALTTPSEFAPISIFRLVGASTDG